MIKRLVLDVNVLRDWEDEESIRTARRSFQFYFLARQTEFGKYSIRDRKGSNVEILVRLDLFDEWERLTRNPRDDVLKSTQTPGREIPRDVPAPFNEQ